MSPTPTDRALRANGWRAQFSMLRLRFVPELPSVPHASEHRRGEVFDGLRRPSRATSKARNWKQWEVTRVERDDIAVGG